MNYLEHTTIVNTNNKEYKCVRLQQYADGFHKATNKYYVNGKIVHNHDRFICEAIIDDQRKYGTFTAKRWTK